MKKNKSDITTASVSKAPWKLVIADYKSEVRLKPVLTASFFNKDSEPSDQSIVDVMKQLGLKRGPDWNTYRSGDGASAPLTIEIKGDDAIKKAISKFGTTIELDISDRFLELRPGRLADLVGETAAKEVRDYDTPELTMSKALRSKLQTLGINRVTRKVLFDFDAQIKALNLKEQHGILSAEDALNGRRVLRALEFDLAKVKPLNAIGLS